MIFHISGLIFCAVVIFLVGRKLSIYGDQIAERTGLGQAWIGMILMATVTSLPELMVGIGSTAIMESADLAVGDILGACALNLGILSFMDVFTPKDHPLFSTASKSHILAATFGIILISLTGLGLYLDADYVIIPSIGLISISFAVIYIISVRTIFKYHKSGIEPTNEQQITDNSMTNKQVYLRFAFLALIIITVSLFLPYFADHIAEESGLGKSFVGSLFLAGSTSLPEIAISISAVRLGYSNLAVGNVMGSIIFNIFILFIGDIFYSKGLLLKDASDANLISVFFIIVMAAIAIIGFAFPYQRKKFIMAWDTLLIFLLYITNMIFLYLATSN
jgi:cation:H+ antiporter